MSKTGASILETEYKVYNNKIVVCKLTFEVELMNSKVITLYPYEIFRKLGIKSDCFETSVTGVARCNDNDEFDETIGRRIAESRAKMKMFKLMKRFQSYICQTLLSTLQDTYHKLEHCTKAERKEFDRLYSLQGLI